MALAHFSLGAAATTLVVTYLLPAVRYPRTAVLAGGGWAMIPDLHWISPVSTGQLRALHDAPGLADVFWFHRTLDRLDPTDSKAVAALFLAGLIAATLVAERRSYRALAPIAAAYEARTDPDPPE